MEKLPFSTLIEFLNGELSPEEEKTVAQYLTTHPEAHQELEEAKEMIEQLNHGELVAPSDSMVNRVQAVFRQKMSQYKERFQREASLTFDSWSQPLPLGVRGLPQERQLLFHDGEYDLDLQLVSEFPGKQLTLRGQILSTEPKHQYNLAGIEMGLQQSVTESNRRSLTDEHGRFSFYQIDEGDYLLTAALKQHDIIIVLNALHIPNKGLKH